MCVKMYISLHKRGFSLAKTWKNQVNGLRLEGTSSKIEETGVISFRTKSGPNEVHFVLVWIFGMLLTY